MAELPECAWLEILIYVISDSTGLTASIKVGGARPTNIYESDWPALIQTACDLLNGMCKVTDARPMTRDEVRKAREADRREDDITDD